MITHLLFFFFPAALEILRTGHTTQATITWPGLNLMPSILLTGIHLFTCNARWWCAGHMIIPPVATRAASLGPREIPALLMKK